MGVAVVTEANRGFGLERARQLKARGASVVAVCRRSSPERDGLGVRIESGVELTAPGRGKKAWPDCAARSSNLATTRWRQPWVATRSSVR